MGAAVSDGRTADPDTGRTVDSDAEGSAGSADDQTERRTAGGALWGIFLAGLLGGFIALLTPCVFPMIPLTVFSSYTLKTVELNRGGVVNWLPVPSSSPVTSYQTGLVPEHCKVACCPSQMLAEAASGGSGLVSSVTVKGADVAVPQ